MKRWKARVKYVDGTFDTFFIDELEELQDLIEGGPDFRLINKIIITYIAMKSKSAYPYKEANSWLNGK